MATIIPFKPSVGRYRFVTVLSGDQYVFNVRWNSRDAAWYFDISEFDQTPIVQGVKVVLGVCFAKWSNHPLFLNGSMIAHSSAPVHVDPGLDDLGASVQVVYLTRAEMMGYLSAAISPAS